MEHVPDEWTPNESDDERERDWLEVYDFCRSL